MWILPAEIPVTTDKRFLSDAARWPVQALGQTCLAVVYHALGRRKEAERELEAFQAMDGNFGALYYADIYAQWGEPAAALRWLTTAERERDSGLR